MICLELTGAPGRRFPAGSGALWRAASGRVIEAIFTLVCDYMPESVWGPVRDVVAVGNGWRITVCFWKEKGRVANAEIAAQEKSQVHENRANVIFLSLPESKMALKWAQPHNLSHIAHLPTHPAHLTCLCPLCSWILFLQSRRVHGAILCMAMNS